MSKPIPSEIEVLKIIDVIKSCEILIPFTEWDPEEDSGDYKKYGQALLEALCKEIKAKSRGRRTWPRQAKHPMCGQGVVVDEPLPPDIDRERGGLFGLLKKVKLLEKKAKLLIECVELLETKVERLENRSTAGCSCGPFQ